MLIIDIEKAVSILQTKRECFVSEADFQLELAWVLKDMYPDAFVRCEYVPTFDTSMHIDILVIRNGKWCPIELKYKTKGSLLHVGEEQYLLKNHGAKDISCYLYLKDIQRIEFIKQQVGSLFSEGYAIMLTNELSYTRSPMKSDCCYKAFSLEEGAVKKGMLDWTEDAGEGTKKYCQEPITLLGDYSCHWKEYSKVEDSNVGHFVYLVMRV